jgi:hypothetical protein
MRKAGVLLAILAVVFVTGAHAAPSAGVTGELRTLYVVATWGPGAFTRAELQEVADRADAFFRASSSGRFSVPGTTAAPIRLPRAVFDHCDATELRNAAPAATFAGYDRIVFVTPTVGACAFHGEANPTEVLLNGQLSVPLAAHELGHTLGLGHASRWECGGRGCSVDEYGGSFSVMGGGSGDLNAYEKGQLEWLTGTVRPTGSATHVIGPIEGSTPLPQAFVVTTARSEVWFESRGVPTPSFEGDGEQPPGVVVLAGPGSGGFESLFPRANLVLPNPAGGPRFSYASGETYVQTGAFRVTVERHDRESAALAFAWLDRVRPARPRLRVTVPRRGRVRVQWDPALERGSGVQTYTLLLDGRQVRSLDGTVPFLNSTVTLAVSRGTHRVAVFATDRAGNRGTTASARVRVP